MQTNIYTLPELTFVGGKTQEIYFHAVDKSGTPYVLEDATIDFSICDYSNKTGTPILSITPSVLVDGSGVPSLIDVNIPASDTVELYGKFIYQITIIDISGKVDIPNQGIMNITKNINKNFI